MDHTDVGEPGIAKEERAELERERQPDTGTVKTEGAVSTKRSTQAQDQGNRETGHATCALKRKKLITAAKQKTRERNIT